MSTAAPAAANAAAPPPSSPPPHERDDDDDEEEEEEEDDGEDEEQSSEDDEQEFEDGGMSAHLPGAHSSFSHLQQQQHHQHAAAMMHQARMQQQHLYHMQMQQQAAAAAAAQHYGGYFMAHGGVGGGGYGAGGGAFAPAPSPPEYFFSDPIVSANNPYAHQMHAYQQQQAWQGGSLQMHSAHTAANQLRATLNSTRGRRKRARGFDEKAVLSASRLIQCRGVDMAVTVVVPDSLEAAALASDVAGAEASASMASDSDATPLVSASGSPALAAVAANGRVSPAVINAAASASAVSAAPADSDAAAGVSSAPDANGAEAAPPPAPVTTQRYPTLFELSHRSDLSDCEDFIVQHGSYLPPLHVRFVAEMNAREQIYTEDPLPDVASPADRPASEADGISKDASTSSTGPSDRDPERTYTVTQGENLTDQALAWLLEDLDEDDPVIGIDAEGRQINVLQLATKSRCVLIKLPKYVDERANSKSSGGAASQTNMPPPAFTTSSSSVSVDAGAIPEPLYQARGVVSGATPPPFPIPTLLRSILEDSQITKSGAELWGDALDIFRDLGVCMNGGANITKSFHPQVLSLEAMTNLALCGGGAGVEGAGSAFRKDKSSTTSTWDAEHLTIRQLIYAALDAQTSYFVGKNLARPKLFDLKKLSQPWLQQAGSWLLMSKYMESAQEKELRASFEDLVLTDQGLSVLMNQYNKRIRIGSDVTVHLTDGSRVACLVTGVQGKRADLQWENAEDVLHKSDVDIERITLTRKWEDTLLPKPVKDYLQSVVHSESENHPIVSALLSFFYQGPDIDPALVQRELTVNSSSLNSQAEQHNPTHQLPPDLLHQSWIAELNESQQYAVALALHNPATTIQGPPGSGKCFARGTQLMLANGRCKPVEQLTAKDQLMGDDGTPRHIMPHSIAYDPRTGERLPTGHGMLYRLSSCVAGCHESFTVNAEHILVLRMDDGSLWQPSLKEFMASDATTQRQARMYQPEALSFADHNGAIAAAVCSTLARPATAAEVAAWSWAIGVWFACCDRSDSHVLHLSSAAPALVAQLQSWYASIAFLTADSPATITHLALGDAQGIFASVLRRLGLLDSRKQLPWSLLTDSIDVRSHLLAGWIDGAGSLQQDSITLTTDSQVLQSQLLHLCRGLGFCAMRNNDKSELAVTLSVASVASLPLALPWALPAAVPSDPASSRCFSFTVTPVGESSYFGFEVDGNRRFLLGDFTVTHNTSTIAAIVRTLICDPNCKILCVARTNTAARHMASAIAEFVGPQKLTLQVSTEFFVDWHESQYTELLQGGYVKNHTSRTSGGKSGGGGGGGNTGAEWQDDGYDGNVGAAYDSSYRDHQVLVMTTGICFTKPELTQGRTVVILDEGSQIWDLEGLLLLRRMDCLEKLILFGDSKQLSCYVAPEWRVSANSILDLANLAATRARLFPAEWAATGLLEVKQCMLNVQYRMVKHLGDMISELFYDSVLRSADTSTVRAVHWHDVRGFSQADDQFSVYNLAEVHEVIRLWRHLCSHGYRADEIVIISMYEAQRQKLAESGVISNARIYNVDSFQGQESAIVILVLANNMITEFLKDSRRVNVACSRAQQRLYIVGDLSTFSVPEAGVWQKIAAYAISDYKPALALPDIRLDQDFPSLASAAAQVTSPATQAAAAPAATASASSAAALAVPVSAWMAAAKPAAVMQTVVAKQPARPQVSTPIASPQSHVALAVRNQAALASAPSTPQQISQPSPQMQHSMQPSPASNLMNRLSYAALGSPALGPQSSSFAQMAAGSQPAASPPPRTTTLTSRAAPFVPSKNATEFVPGGAFKMAASTPAPAAAAAAPVVAAAAVTPAAAVVAPSPAPTAASIVANAASRAMTAEPVPTSAHRSTPVHAAMPAPSPAADVPSGPASAVDRSTVVAAPLAPSSTSPVSAALLSPNSVPSIHHPEAFPAISVGAAAAGPATSPAAATSYSFRNNAPLSFAARVAAAAAAAGPSPGAAATPTASLLAASSAPGAAPPSVVAPAFKPTTAAPSFKTAVVAGAMATPTKNAVAAPAPAAASNGAATVAAAPSTAGVPKPAASPTAVTAVKPAVATPVKPISFAASVGAGSAAKKKPATKPTGWTCKACTMVNMTAQRFCEVCQSERTDA